MTLTEQIDELQAEGFGLYTELTAIAMTRPHSDEVRDGLRRLAEIKADIEALEQERDEEMLISEAEARAEEGSIAARRFLNSHDRRP